MIGWLHDPRLKPLALSPLPAWLWSHDATRVLWANAAGAAVLGAPTPAALSVCTFDCHHAVAAQVARLAQAFRHDGAARLERLHGLGAGRDRVLTCACSYLTLADGSPAVLIAAMERGAADLSLGERVARLLAGGVEPVAVFGDDGALIGATPAAQRLLGERTSLDALGAGALAATARDEGHAAGAWAAGAVSIARIAEPPVWIAAFGEAELHRASTATPAPSPASDPAPPAALRRTTDDAGDSTAAEQPELFPDFASATPVPPALAEDRRYPLRFVWQMDPEGRLTIDSAEFIAIIGPRTAALLGQPWPFIASVTNLDPQGQVARAVATRSTWSGVSVSWRVDDSDERLAVELSGLPVFDRERTFRGYRGFGVCRDIDRLNAIAEARRTGVAITPAADEASADVRPEEAPGLTPVERYAFDELSRRLTSRINDADAQTRHAANLNEPPEPTDRDAADEPPETEPAITDATRPFLDRLPIGVLVYRLGDLLYANQAFLAWAGSDSLEALAEAGGLDSLAIESGNMSVEDGGRKPFAIASLRDANAVAEARLLQVPWDDASAYALLIVPPAGETAGGASAAAMQAQLDELGAILDTATDGVIVLDRAARIVSSNRSAQALFGYDAEELEGCSFADLFAPESIGAAIDYLDRLQGRGAASLLDGGREIVGRERLGGLIPLVVTMARLGDAGDRYCAVFRDITPWKKSEEELTAARREAEQASSARSEFLAKLNQEIHAPLNAIIGFADAMTEERFGPIGNERYRHYVRDIRASGTHLVALVNDLLDLSRIEAGKLELTFAGVSLNEVTQQCVAIMQPQANRERVIIRMSLSPRLPQVLADARSVRQIVLNLLSNSIKFTAPGGQVIVSTAIADTGEVALRVRDTGVGMSEKDLAAALEPFRPVAPATRSGRSGLGLPLTRALAEANHATFHIRSRPNKGTLVEITFPAAQLLAAQ